MMTEPYLAVFHPPEGYESQYPFKDGDLVVVLGELENMPEHCAIATTDGKVHFPYHLDGFRKMGYTEV